MDRTLEAVSSHMSRNVQEQPTPIATTPARTLPVLEADQKGPAGEPARRPWYRKPIVVIAMAAVIVVASGFGGRAYLHARGHESTDDAFIEGRVVQMSPRIAGHVAKLLVTDNEHVEAGQVLVEIDARDFQARVDGARSALDAAKGKESAAKAQLDLVTVTSGADVSSARAGEAQARSGVETAQAAVTAAESAAAEADARVAASDAVVAEAKADVAAARADQYRAATELKRFEQMHGVQVASDQELVNARATSLAADAKADAAVKKVAAAEAAVAQAKAGRASAAAALAQAQSQVGQARAKLAEAASHVEQASVAPQRVQSAKSDLATASAEVRRLEAQLHQAELDLSYTRIRAPEAGRVTRRTVEEGNYVQPGQAMFALVPQGMWVVANFKETQLDGMRPGQHVDVKVDAYPGLKLPGHVDSVPLTNLAMGLLANEQMGNATGIYNLMRNLGGGVGIAWVTTLLARGSQAAQANLATNTSVYNPTFQERIATIAGGLTPQVGSVAAHQQAYGMVYAKLNRQAAYWAYINDFRFLAVMSLACLPLCFLFKQVAARKGAVAAH